MHISIKVLIFLIAIVAALIAAFSVASIYHEVKFKKMLSIAEEKEKLRTEYKLVAKRSPNTRTALNELYILGATGVEAVIALHAGRDISVEDSKRAVIESNRWDSEIESVEELKLVKVEFKFE